MKKLILLKNKLEKHYIKDKMTTYQIAGLLGCSQALVWKRLKEFNIKTRRPHELYSNVPSKEKLFDLYVSKKLSTWEIEKRYGYSRGTIHKKLIEYGIGVRSRADSHMIYGRKDFSGDLFEKAYLIGFRIGDLGVRKVYPHSKTILVATGSTIEEQINLVTNLFEGYSNVWVKKTGNKTNIQVGLNESFNFLLDKNAPKWIFERKYFFAFLSGFTDAEGWIGAHNKMAVYSLGNYDRILLDSIRKSLIKFGIKCPKIAENRRKGKPTTEGYNFKSDYFSLRINRKKDLMKLFLLMKPHIKHMKKIKSLNEAIDNIRRRNGEI